MFCLSNHAKLIELPDPPEECCQHASCCPACTCKQALRSVGLDIFLGQLAKRGQESLLVSSLSAEAYP